MKRKPDSEKFPRKITTSRRCQALDMNGMRCNAMAKYEVALHLSDTHDRDIISWVVTCVCTKHTEHQHLQTLK